MGTHAGILFLNKLLGNLDAQRDQDFPEFIFHNNSQVPDRTRAIIYNEVSPLNELKRSLEILTGCNVDYIVSTCVTSYYFLNQLDKPASGKLIDPIELIVKKLMNEYPHVQKIGLLATTGTLKSELFHKAFSNLPFELIALTPEIQEQKFMKAVYGDGGFKSFPVAPAAYKLFLEAVNYLIDQDVELILGGCTEVQIGLKAVKPSVECLDVIDVLVEEVVRIMNLKNKKTEL